MTDKEQTHIYQQFKNIGAGNAFTPALIFDLKAGVAEKQHPYSFDNNGDKVDVLFHIKKSENSNLYFLNKYEMAITPENKPAEIRDTFYTAEPRNVKLQPGEERLNNLNRFTLKKAANYLAGRPVFNAFTDKEGNQYEAWAKRKFDTGKGKHIMAKYRKEYPFAMETAVKKYSIKELTVPLFQERMYDSFKRGNLQLVNFVGNGGHEEKLYASLNIGLIAGGSLDVYNLNKEKLSTQELFDRGFIGNDLAEKLKERMTKKIEPITQNLKPAKEGGEVKPEVKLVKEKKITKKQKMS
jgi:hypothetical protein